MRQRQITGIATNFFNEADNFMEELKNNNYYTGVDQQMKLVRYFNGFGKLFRDKKHHTLQFKVLQYLIEKGVLDEITWFETYGLYQELYESQMYFFCSLFRSGVMVSEEVEKVLIGVREGKMGGGREREKKREKGEKDIESEQDEEGERNEYKVSEYRMKGVTNTTNTNTNTNTNTTPLTPFTPEITNQSISFTLKVLNKITLDFRTPARTKWAIQIFTSGTNFLSKRPKWLDTWMKRNKHKNTLEWGFRDPAALYLSLPYSAIDSLFFIATRYIDQEHGVVLFESVFAAIKASEQAQKIQSFGSLKRHMINTIVDGYDHLSEQDFKHEKERKPTGRIRKYFKIYEKAPKSVKKQFVDALLAGIETAIEGDKKELALVVFVLFLQYKFEDGYVDHETIKFLKITWRKKSFSMGETSRIIFELIKTKKRRLIMTLVCTYQRNGTVSLGSRNGTVKPRRVEFRDVRDGVNEAGTVSETVSETGTVNEAGTVSETSTVNQTSTVSLSSHKPYAKLLLTQLLEFFFNPPEENQLLLETFRLLKMELERPMCFSCVDVDLIMDAHTKSARFFQMVLKETQEDGESETHLVILDSCLMEKLSFEVDIESSRLVSRKRIKDNIELFNRLKVFMS